MSKVSVTIEIDERYFRNVLAAHGLKIADADRFTEWVAGPEFSKMLADNICIGWMGTHKEVSSRPALIELFKTVLENNG